jgi:hypothetical protein
MKNHSGLFKLSNNIHYLLALRTPREQENKKDFLAKPQPSMLSAWIRRGKSALTQY